MPIFMDRHIVPGIEAKHAAQAHREDLKIQDEYGCRCMTYWVDEDRGSAFCLIDAPNEESVKKMHDRAHGLVPHEIVQVNSNVVEAFLGRIEDPDGYYDPDEPDLKIFNDPAFRIILVARADDSKLLKNRLGSKKAERLLALYHEIIREQVNENQGREVELKGERFIASFVSVTQAFACTKGVQKGLHVAGELIGLRMGLNAGMPVTKDKSIFGDVIRMAEYLCLTGVPNQTIMASIIKELYKDDGQYNIGDKALFKSISPADENVLQLLLDVLRDHHANPQFGIQDFCKKTGMSKSKLYRQSTSLLGLSPNELVREYRLKKALSFLKTDRNIAQTAFDCGFGSPSYFTKCFQDRFGLQPLAYQKLA
ncbi:nickel-binding protein [Allomuricauda sp. d1]|uniref:nickel-binding protein n=1 Tax=Allomuricauda sp. d1 TaxID=3136725 RepID=UPI0031DD3E9D